MSGKPSIVLNKSGIDFIELRRNNMDVEDLIESMRSAGYFSLDDLDYAIFESSGKLSAKERPDYNKKQSSLPILLVSEGKIIRKNLGIIKTDEQKLTEMLKKHGERNLKKIGVMTVDGNGKVYLQNEKSSYRTFNVQLAEGVKW